MNSHWIDFMDVVDIADRFLYKIFPGLYDSLDVVLFEKLSQKSQSSKVYDYLIKDLTEFEWTELFNKLIDNEYFNIFEELLNEYPDVIRHPKMSEILTSCLIHYSQFNLVFKICRKFNFKFKMGQDIFKSCKVLEYVVVRKFAELNDGKSWKIGKIIRRDDYKKFKFIIDHGYLDLNTCYRVINSDAEQCRKILLEKRKYSTELIQVQINKNIEFDVGKIPDENIDDVNLYIKLAIKQNNLQLVEQLLINFPDSIEYARNITVSDPYCLLHRYNIYMMINMDLCEFNWNQFLTIDETVRENFYKTQRGFIVQLLKYNQYRLNVFRDDALMKIFIEDDNDNYGAWYYLYSQRFSNWATLVEKLRRVMFAPKLSSMIYRTYFNKFYLHIIKSGNWDVICMAKKQLGIPMDLIYQIINTDEKITSLKLIYEIYQELLENAPEKLYVMDHIVKRTNNYYHTDISFSQFKEIARFFREDPESIYNICLYQSDKPDGYIECTEWIRYLWEINIYLPFDEKYKIIWNELIYYAYMVDEFERELFENIDHKQLAEYYCKRKIYPRKDILVNYSEWCKSECVDEDYWKGLIVRYDRLDLLIESLKNPRFKYLTIYMLTYPNKFSSMLGKISNNLLDSFDELFRKMDLMNDTYFNNIFKLYDFTNIQTRKDLLRATIKQFGDQSPFVSRIVEEFLHKFQMPKDQINYYFGRWVYQMLPKCDNCKINKLECECRQISGDEFEVL